MTDRPDSAQLSDVGTIAREFVRHWRAFHETPTSMVAGQTFDEFADDGVAAGLALSAATRALLLLHKHPWMQTPTTSEERLPVLSYVYSAFCQVRREAGNVEHPKYGWTPDVQGIKLASIERLEKRAADVLDYADALAAEKPAGTPNKESQWRGSQVAKALAILIEHTDWTTKRIAEVAGCNAKYLSQSPTFKAAKKAIQGIGQENLTRSKKTARKGSKGNYHDGYRGTDTDAYGDDEG